MIDFPNAPTVGQQFTAAGVTWTWDGAKWTANGLNVPYLPLAGGTMAGPITLPGNPTAALQATPKQYVDNIPANYPIGDNRIINGDMRIDQRNGGASGTANAYTVDRWQFGGNLATKGNWGRNAGALATPVGFPYYLGFVSNSAYAPAAGDTFVFQQAIEADQISDFAWGTANAQPVTLSFLAYSSLTGTFGGAIRNYAGTRAYPFTFSIPTASTWTKITLTIPGDTAGAWVLSGNAGSMWLAFDLGSGSTSRGSAGAWANAALVGATGAVSVVSTNSALFFVTGVKLELGSVATPFNRQSLAKSLADCQRYYQSWNNNYLAMGYTTAGLAVYGLHALPTTMRAIPIVAFTGQTYTNCSSLAALTPDVSHLSLSVIATATGNAYVVANITLTAEL